jgi:hypothetical protein
MCADVAKQTASTDGPTTNPWSNMAGHLAKKAAENSWVNKVALPTC